MPDNFSVKLDGGDELFRKLKQLGPEALKTAAASLYRSAERTMTRSKEDFVPVDTGALRSTGTVMPPEITQNNITVELGYGGPSVDYAVIVHEDPSAHHKPPTQWKYLETPLKEDEPLIVTDLIHDLNDAFEHL